MRPHCDQCVCNASHSEPVIRCTFRARAAVVCDACMYMQVSDIVKQTPDTRQVLVFSATLPAAVAEFTRIGLRSPELVRLDADTKLSPDLQLTFFAMRQVDKPAALLQVLRELIPDGSPTIVFVSTKHRVEYLTMLLEQVRSARLHTELDVWPVCCVLRCICRSARAPSSGISGLVQRHTACKIHVRVALQDNVPCCSVYGAMDQTARKISVGKFRGGRCQFLLVTDVAARGIDIPLIDNVINYDFTPKPKLFVHRAGRAARCGRPGSAISFVTAEDYPYLIDLHLFLSRPLRMVPQAGSGDSGAQDAGTAEAAGAKAQDSWCASRRWYQCDTKVPCGGPLPMLYRLRGCGPERSLTFCSAICDTRACLQAGRVP